MAASYPTSIKSFTTKQDDVDDVLAEHINSLQDEVVALETQLGVNWKGVVQVVNNQESSYQTCSTNIPFDDTIPQNTEGDQLLSVTITPKSATNKLLIEVIVHGANSISSYPAAALFHTVGGIAVASALAASWDYANANMGQVKFSYFMTAGEIVAKTFTVRVGSSSGNFYANGDSSARKYGGVAYSSITVKEIKV